MAEPGEVIDNQKARRFELAVDGETAVLEYAREGDHLVLEHTEVPEKLTGRGYGGKLARAALERARREQLRVVPHCSFVRGYIERNPEYEGLVDEEY